MACNNQAIRGDFCGVARGGYARYQVCFEQGVVKASPHKVEVEE